MKKALILFTICLFSSALTAQLWELNYNQQGYMSTVDVEFATHDIGFVVGLNTCWKTIDGGESWIDLNWLGYMNTIEFYGTDVGFIGGDDGVLYKTTDGGATWNTLSTNNTETFNQLFFLSESIGYAITYNPVNYYTHIKKTTDGGLTWNQLGPLYTTSSMRDVYFLNENVGLISGSAGQNIWRTTDGGNTWTWQSFDAWTSLASMDFVNATTGFAAGNNGEIFKTTDAGITWQAMFNPDPDDLREIQFTDPLNGWVCGYNGTILKTANGGLSWFPQPINTTNMVSDLYMYNSTNGFAVTFNEWTGGDIYTYNSQNASVVRGKVFSDPDDNCLLAENELTQANMFVQALPGPFYGITDSSGNYALEVPPGNYIVSQVFPDYVGILIQSHCPEDGYPVNFDDYNNDTTGFDFGNVMMDCPYLVTDVMSTLTRPCTSSTLVVSWHNLGAALAENCMLTVDISEHLTLTSADHPWILNADSTYSFFVGDVEPGGFGAIHITDLVVCDPELNGQAVCTEAWITPKNVCPEPDQLWDGSNIEAGAECLSGGSYIRLSLHNEGQSMSDSTDYRIFKNSFLLTNGKYKLAADDSIVFVINSEGQTYRIEGDQNPYHPTKSQTNATIEACTRDSSGFFVIGFLRQLPPDDENPETSIVCQIISNAVDPNEKTVFPEGVGEEHFLPLDNELKFHVCFQNTGNDTAFRIVVIDTLSPFLDPLTFRMGPDTHDFTYDFIESTIPGLRFIFDNILLPDSTTNEPESHGCFDYYIRPYASTPQGSVIENFADIYFDFNAPVRTNTAFITVHDEQLISESNNPVYNWPHLVGDNEICPGDSTELTFYAGGEVWWSEANNPNIEIATGPMLVVAPGMNTTFIAHSPSGDATIDISVYDDDADLNSDGMISVEDLLLLIEDFGCISSCNADIDGDQIVGVVDVMILSARMGQSCN